jgi:hypothetical protein
MELLRRLWGPTFADLSKPMDLYDTFTIGAQGELETWLVESVAYIFIGNKLNKEDSETAGYFCTLSSFMKETANIREQTENALIELGLGDYEFDTYYFNKIQGVKNPNQTRVCEEINEMIESRLEEKIE